MKRRRHVWLWLTGATAVNAAIVACTTYRGEDVSDANDAAPDGVTAAADAPVVSNDGDAKDGASDPKDGGRGPCPDGGFCDSFERSTTQGSWGYFFGGAPCELAIDSMQATDGVSSLRNDLPLTDAGSCKMSLWRQFAGAPKSVSVSFDIRITSTPDRNVHFAQFYVAATSRYVFFALYPGGLEFVEQSDGDGGAYLGTPIGGLAPGDWHRLAYDYEIATKHATAWVDGEKRLDKTMTYSLAAPSFELSIGVNWSTKGGPLQVWFDDYRFLPQY